MIWRLEKWEKWEGVGLLPLPFFVGRCCRLYLRDCDNGGFPRIRVLFHFFLTLFLFFSLSFLFLFLFLFLLFFLSHFRDHDSSFD